MKVLVYKDEIIIKCKEKLIKIPIDNIRFIEISGVHKVRFYLENESIEVYTTLKFLENISSKFYRCHRGYIVNIDKIKEINVKQKIITMDNNKICFVSCRCMRPFLNKLDNLADVLGI